MYPPIRGGASPKSARAATEKPPGVWLIQKNLRKNRFAASGLAAGAASR